MDLIINDDTNLEVSTSATFLSVIPLKPTDRLKSHSEIHLDLIEELAHLLISYPKAEILTKFHPLKSLPIFHFPEESKKVVLLCFDLAQKIKDFCVSFQASDQKNSFNKLAFLLQSGKIRFALGAVQNWIDELPLKRQDLVTQLDEKSGSYTFVRRAFKPGAHFLVKNEQIQTITVSNKGSSNSRAGKL